MNNRALSIYKEIMGKDNLIVDLATTDNKRPYVRQMLLRNIDNRLYMATFSKSNKVEQVMINNNVELMFNYSISSGRGNVRIAGFLEERKDKEARYEYAETTDSFSSFWDSPDNNDYLLLEFIPQSVILTLPDEFMPIEISLK